jgi:hypothetical protein
MLKVDFSPSPRSSSTGLISYYLCLLYSAPVGLRLTCPPTLFFSKTKYRKLLRAARPLVVGSGQCQCQRPQRLTARRGSRHWLPRLKSKK